MIMVDDDRSVMEMKRDGRKIHEDQGLLVVNSLERGIRSLRMETRWKTEGMETRGSPMLVPEVGTAAYRVIQSFSKYPWPS